MLILEDIDAIRSKAMATVVDQIEALQMNTRYGIKNPICDSSNPLCLYILLYGLDSYNPTADFNFLTDFQVINILNGIENLTKQCC